MSMSDIRAALVDRWEDANQLKLDEGPVQVAYENINFTPPENDRWAQVFHLAGSPSVGSLGSQGEDQISGVFQIDLLVPVGTGVEWLYRAVDILRQKSFRAGEYLTAGSQWVLVLSCGMESPVREGAYMKGTIRIEWESRITRRIING